MNGTFSIKESLWKAIGTLMNEISTLTEETPESSLTPSAMWSHSESTAI